MRFAHPVATPSFATIEVLIFTLTVKKKTCLCWLNFASSFKIVFGFVNTSIVIREAGEERTTVAVTTIKGPIPRRLSLRVLIIDGTASLGKSSPLVKLYRLLLNFF